MAPAPSVVVFDVNGTLSDLTPLGRRLEAVGAPASLLPSWFAAVLRDGIALTAVGGFATFRALAVANLRMLLPRDAGGGDVAAAAEHVVDGFAELDAYPDVAAGLRALAAAGVRILTLTNGSVEVTEALLRRGGLLDLVEHRLDVTTTRRWKPAPEPYRHALHVAGVRPGEAALVAVHPWDIEGAQRVGLTGGWLDRDEVPWPEPFAPPAVQARDLPTLVARLLG